MLDFSLQSYLQRNQSSTSKSARQRRGCNGPQAEVEALEPRQLFSTITWTSGIITGPDVVSLNGSLVFAIDGAEDTGGTSRVNGVEFVSSRRSNAQSQSQAQSPGSESITTTLRDEENNAFTHGGVDDEIGSLLEGGWFGAASGNSATVTLNGLEVGDVYEVQLFASDARADRGGMGFVTRVGDGEGGTGVDLNLNNQAFGERRGDFGIGTFTADSTTQSFDLTGWANGGNSTGRIQINAIQLRKIEPVVLLPGAVPLINEFSASNAGFLDDDNGNSTDWIEIFNAGEDAIDLAGYSLTDDPNNTSRFVFPSTTLGGGEYLVVFAGDDDDPTTGTDLYTGFGLSSSGEYLGFYDPSGNVVTEFGLGGADFPAQLPNVSYGFLADDTYSQVSFFGTPTPGSANVDPADGIIDSVPTVSVERGFHDEAFDVDIVSQTAGATLVYTTDGSEPSLTNGTQVQAANANAFAQITLNIAETTSLRTGSFLPDFITQGSTTHSYVFLDDVVTQDLIDQTVTDQYSQEILRDALLSLPTVSFNFDDEIGRFDPERRTSIEYLAADGSEGFQVDAGIRPFGGAVTNFAKRNFRVNFRGEYGTSRLEFPLFEGFGDGVTPATTSFDTLDFRAGSQDRRQRGFGLSNRFVDETLLAAGHAATHGRFVHLYLNGEYWGQYHLREHIDDDFAASYFGGDSEDYDSIQGNDHGGPGGFSLGRVDDGSGAAWENLTSIVNDTSLSPAERFAALSQAVDLEQYLDFALIFAVGASEPEFDAIGASDGSVPFTFHFNDSDGFLRDPLDGTNGNNPNIAGDKTDNPGPLGILGTLVEEGDPEFLTLYSDRIQRLFLGDGALSVDQSTARLQELIDQVELSVILEEARWGTTTSTSNPTGGSLSVAEFQERSQDALDRILPEIVEGDNNVITRLRALGVFPDIDAPAFLLGGVPQFGGEIAAGSELAFSASDTVYYTTDGSDPRLVGGGINPAAIAFSASETTSNIFEFGSEWRFEDSGIDLGTAWRGSSFNDASWSSGVGEFGFGQATTDTTVSFGDDASNKHTTTYFRNTFNVDAENVTSVTLNVLRDDGIVIYLNGQEIGRDNISGDVNFQTFADSAIGGSAERTPISFTIPASLLVSGENTLAVEVHQATPGSTDLTFDAELSVTQAATPDDAIVLDASTTILARTFSDGEWSALSQGTFAIPAPQSDLRISEIHFNPADPTAAEIAAGFDDNDDFEFIEIFNPSTVGSVNLAGLQLAGGVDFDFGDFELSPGQRVVVVEDVDAFRFRYGDGPTVLGQWSGGLSNGGEELILLDSLGGEVVSVDYGDSGLWPVAADGRGASLVLIDDAQTPASEVGKHYRWAASTTFNGTPGEASVAPQGVVINEVLAHTDAPQSDAIELFNTTAQAIDVSGWFLSDSGESPFKFRVPDGTVIAAGGYVSFDESDFNPTPLNPGPNDFALSSAGDQVYLTRNDGGQPVFEDVVDFGATFNGESLGRLPSSAGRLGRLAEPSLGAENGAPAVSDVVLSEFSYHPAEPAAEALAIDPTLTEGDLEFVAIFNTRSTAIDLGEYRLRGEADVDFAPGTALAAASAVTVVTFDPDANPLKAQAFRAHYGLEAGARLLGADTSNLNNSFGRIVLQQADGPPAADPSLTPFVAIDQVVYDDLLPFEDADGNGLSLNRISAEAFGDDPASWVAAAPGTFHDEVTGDYNADGIVSQGDLDLVLLNFGSTAPASWINQRPDGVVRQAQLDGVLLNFGRTVSLAGLPVSSTATATAPAPAINLNAFLEQEASEAEPLAVASPAADSDAAEPADEAIVQEQENEVALAPAPVATPTPTPVVEAGAAPSTLIAEELAVTVVDEGEEQTDVAAPVNAVAEPQTPEVARAVVEATPAAVTAPVVTADAAVEVAAAGPEKQDGVTSTPVPTPVVEAEAAPSTLIGEDSVAATAVETQPDASVPVGAVVEAETPELAPIVVEATPTAVTAPVATADAAVEVAAAGPEKQDGVTSTPVPTPVVEAEAAPSTLIAEDLEVNVATVGEAQPDASAPVGVVVEPQTPEAARVVVEATPAAVTAPTVTPDAVFELVAAANPEDRDDATAEVSEPAPEVAVERDDQVAIQSTAQDADNERIRQSYLAWVTYLRPTSAGPGERGFVGPLQANAFAFDEDTDETKDADGPVVAKSYVSPPTI